MQYYALILLTFVLQLVVIEVMKHCQKIKLQKRSASEMLQNRETDYSNSL